MAISLTVRIVLSIALFVLLFIGFRMGWIQPHGIYPEQPDNSIPETERALPEQRP